MPRIRNKELNKKHFKTWYEKNKKLQAKRCLENRKRIKEWLKEFKSTLKCIKCGENHPSCLDFHHRDSEEKEGDISGIVGRKGWGIEKILKEIEKCDVLCANCHRKLHYEERQRDSASS